MENKEKKEIAKFYGAMSHPIRLEMIQFLGEKTRASFTDLKTALNIGDGKLYYHLGMLGSLVAQDEDSRYFLSNQGRRALRFLVSDEGQSVDVLSVKAKGGWVGRLYGYAAHLLLPGWLISYLFISPLRNAVELALLMVLGSWAAGVSGLKPSLLLLSYAPDHPSPWIMLEYILAWLFIYILSNLLSTLLGKKGDHLNLFVGTTFSRFPIVSFTLLWMLDRSFGWGLASLYGGALLRVILLLCLGWSLCLLTLAVSQAKRLSLGRAAIVALFVTYIDIAYFLVTQGI